MQSYQIGRLTLHPGRELLDGRAPVAIGGRALDLLSALAAADGAVMSKDELLAAVWNGAIVEDNALQAQVSAARKALAGEAARLVTVHGRGYRLELDGWTAVAAPRAAPSSMVVFGFDNLTGDPANEYLCDGLAEELVATFAPVPDLLVPEFGLSMAFRGSGLDVLAMARGPWPGSAAIRDSRRSLATSGCSPIGSATARPTATRSVTGGCWCCDRSHGDALTGSIDARSAMAGPAALTW